MNWQSREDERVARALDGAPPPYEREDRAVLALAERIREVPTGADLDAAPDFRDALRARLLTEGAALLPHPRDPLDLPEAAPPRRARHTAGPPRGRAADRARVRRRRRAATAGVLVAATLSVGTVAASSTAVPGDPLYGIKRRVQGVEVALARGDVDRGQRHLELARTRVRELGTAGRSTGAGPLVAALDDMDSDTRTGVRLLSTVAVRRTDPTRLTALDAWTAEQRALLSTTAPKLPAAARSRAAVSLALLGDVATRVASLHDTLRCDCPAAAPVDELGPLPCADCGPEPSVPPVPPTAGPASSAPPLPTAAASRPVPTGPATVPGSPAPSTGLPVPVPTAGPTSVPLPVPAPRPPANATSPVPVPVPVEPSPSPQPTPEPTPPPVIPDNVATDLLDGLLGAIGLGRP